MFVNNSTDLRSILQSIPYKALLSLENARERRANALRQLKDLNIEAEWLVPIKANAIDWSSIPPAFRRAPKYGSHAVTMLAMFDEAIRRGVDTFMHIEDDVVFHHQILERLPNIFVPGNWRFIYLGGRSYGRRQKVSNGLVRSHAVGDLHAVVMRSDMIPLMKDALLDSKSNFQWCDARISSLHKKWPAYLCRPNLAWQAPHCNDRGTGAPYSNYFEDGRVKPGQGE